MADLTPELVIFAKRVAARRARNLPPCFDLADLEQVALIAVWQRLDAYDPSTNVPITAYLRPWVNGALLMSVRRKNWTEETASMFGLEPAQGTAIEDEAQERGAELASLGIFMETLEDDELDAIASHYLLGETAAEVVKSGRAGSEAEVWEVRARALRKMRERAAQLGAIDNL
jgi:RNA polymerase sigma factor (sigma-70 family)